MRHLLSLMASLLLLCGPVLAKTKDSLPVLLIVGAPHFASPGLDEVNLQAPNVLAPERQREIEELVDHLAAFRPTRIAVEWPADRQAELDRRYAEYGAGRYELMASERDQIGFRLAARLGLDRIDAVDWNGAAPGDPSDYNFPAYAEAHDLGEAWEGKLTELEKAAAANEKLMDCTPVSDWIRRVNTPEYRAADHRTYHFIAQLGDRFAANPGAAWVGTWYARNLRILNNIRAITSNPEDRVLVIFGAGHSYLLDQQARESGEFRVEDTLAHLPPPAGPELAICPN